MAKKKFKYRITTRERTLPNLSALFFACSASSRLCAQFRERFQSPHGPLPEQVTIRRRILITLPAVNLTSLPSGETMAWRPFWLNSPSAAPLAAGNFADRRRV
jgi:hypothetical protein